MVEMPKPMLPDFKGTPLSFFNDVKKELKKVIWPTKEEVIKLTVIVITVSIAIGIYIGGLDFILTKTTNLIVRR